MEKQAEVLGVTGQRFARRLRLRRQELGLTLGQVSERLRDLGRPIIVSTLSKIENAQRRCDIDDLVALALAVEASPGDLLVPGSRASSTPVQLTSSYAVDAVEASSWVSGQVSRPAKVALTVSKNLLVVVRTHTAMDRVLELVRALGGRGHTITVKFTIDVGSAFARGLSRQLESLGAEEIPWDEAARLEWDAILSAHPSERLSELKGPTLVIPQGAGYNRVSRRSAHRGVGVLGVPHESFRSQIDEELRDQTVVIGDLVMDKLRASKPQRRRFRDAIGVGDRRLVVVSSTWGANSLHGSNRRLVDRLVAELPSDDYLVALLLHPNIWFGCSRFELMTEFRDALDSGLLIVDHASWQAPLIAADLVIGDHGSVTTYAAGLDLPVLTVGAGADEIDPLSPVAMLHSEAPVMRSDAKVIYQVEQAIEEHEPGRWRPFTDQIFGMPGEGLKSMVDCLRGLMNLPPQADVPRISPISGPQIACGHPVTAYRTTVELQIDHETPSCHVRRYPAILTSPQDHVDSFLVVDDREVDPSIRDNAEIVICSEVVSEGEAHEWAGEILPFSGAALAAAEVADGVLLTFRDGHTAHAWGADPFSLTAALYGLRLAGHRLDAGLEFTVVMGRTAGSARVRSSSFKEPRTGSTPTRPR